MGLYDWCFYKFEKETPARNDGMLPAVAQYFRGERSIPGAGIYLPYRSYQKPGVIDSEPHFHRDEEYLAFVGHDMRDAFESFDAEIEMWMGEDRDDMEKIVITSPTMIRVPKFYWHGPIIIKKLGKPLFFQPILYSKKYYAIKYREADDGHVYYKMLLEGLSPCELDNKKVCDFCGKCKAGTEAE